MTAARIAPKTTATPEKVVRPAALKAMGLEVGVVMPVLEGPTEPAETPAGAVGAVGIRRMEEVLAPQDMLQTVVVLVTVTVTLEDWPAETPGALECPDMLGAEGETAGAEEPEGELVTAGMVPVGVEPPMTVEETVAEVSVSQGVVVAAAGVEELMTVEETMAEVSVSQGVVVASAGVDELMTVEETMVEVSVSQGVVVAEEVEPEPPSWQSASPRTARHRLMGMLMRPPEEEDCCLQWTSPRTARQTLIGTLIREPPLLEEVEAWSHLALPRAAMQPLTGTLIKPLVADCCLHSASPRIPVQRPTGTLIKPSVAWTPEAEAARATREVIIDCFILSKRG